MPKSWNLWSWCNLVLLNSDTTRTLKSQTLASELFFLKKDFTIFNSLRLLSLQLVLGWCSVFLFVRLPLACSRPFLWSSRSQQHSQDEPRLSTMKTWVCACRGKIFFFGANLHFGSILHSCNVSSSIFSFPTSSTFETILTYQLVLALGSLCSWWKVTWFADFVLAFLLLVQLEQVNWIVPNVCSGVPIKMYGGSKVFVRRWKERFDWPTGSSDGVVFFFLGRISFQAGTTSGGGGCSRGQDLVWVMRTGWGYMCEIPDCLSPSLASAWKTNLVFNWFNILLPVFALFSIHWRQAPFHVRNFTLRKGAPEVKTVSARLPSLPRRTLWPGTWEVRCRKQRQWSLDALAQTGPQAGCAPLQTQLKCRVLQFGIKHLLIHQTGERGRSKDPTSGQWWVFCCEKGQQPSSGVARPINRCPKGVFSETSRHRVQGQWGVNLWCQWWSHDPPGAHPPCHQWNVV